MRYDSHIAPPTTKAKTTMSDHTNDCIEINEDSATAICICNPSDPDYPTFPTIS